MYTHTIDPLNDADATFDARCCPYSGKLWVSSQKKCFEGPFSQVDCGRWGLGFGIGGLGFGIWGLGFGAWGFGQTGADVGDGASCHLGFRVHGGWFRV